MKNEPLDDQTATSQPDLPSLPDLDDHLAPSPKKIKVEQGENVLPEVPEPTCCSNVAVCWMEDVLFVKEEKREDSLSESHEKEVDFYLKEEITSGDCKVQGFSLKWWSTNERFYPTLAKLALKYGHTSYICTCRKNLEFGW